MSPREARVSRNEELFRQLNLNIADLQNGRLNLVQDGFLPLVCECAHTGCTTPIEVDPASFEQVHQTPLRFLVALGHEDLDVESVVERHAAFLVVEKNRT